MSEATPTTAAVLLSYRKELLDGGIDPTIADEMTREAARSVVALDECLVVRR